VSRFGKAFNWLFLLAGIGLFALLLIRLDLDAVVAHLLRAGWMIAPALLAYVVSLAFSTLVWMQAIEPQPENPGFGHVFAAFWAGHAVNGVTPGAAGDVFRGTLLARRVAGEEVVASLVVYNYLMAVMMLVTTVAGPLVCLMWLDLPVRVIGGLLALAAVVALLMAGITLLLRRGLAGWLVRHAGRLPGLRRRDLGRLEHRALRVDERIRAFRHRRPAAFRRALAYALVVRVAMVAELWLFLLALLPRYGSGWLFLLALLTQSTTQIVSLAAAFIPGRIGALEAAAALLFKLVGLDPAVGLAAAILRRARKLLGIAVGLLIGAGFALVARRDSRARVEETFTSGGSSSPPA
jgi:uncharacterized protein (TIRG00374 family)